MSVDIIKRVYVYMPSYFAYKQSLHINSEMQSNSKMKTIETNRKK